MYVKKYSAGIYPSYSAQDIYHQTTRNDHLNLDVGDGVNHDGKSALPRIQISGGNTLGAQIGHEQATERLEEGTLDTTGLVAVSHIFDLAEELQSVVHGRDNDVEAISDEFNLGVESSVRGQVVDGD